MNEEELLDMSGTFTAELMLDGKDDYNADVSGNEFGKMMLGGKDDYNADVSGNEFGKNAHVRRKRC
jgi:hypothetical protein